MTPTNWQMDSPPCVRALNNQGFCAFIMDFEKAEDLFRRVYEESNNELEMSDSRYRYDENLSAYLHDLRSSMIIVTVRYGV